MNNHYTVRLGGDRRGREEVYLVLPQVARRLVGEDGCEHRPMSLRVTTVH